MIYRIALRRGLEAARRVVGDCLLFFCLGGFIPLGLYIFYAGLTHPKEPYAPVAWVFGFYLVGSGLFLDILWIQWVVKPFVRKILMERKIRKWQKI